MSIFVSFTFSSMDSDAPIFGNRIIDDPVVTEIKSQHDLSALEEQVRTTFGMPDDFRWVQISNWKWLPESPIVTLDTLNEIVSA